MALPGWHAPRLLMTAGDISQRWQQSAFYPAFRLRGRLYRSTLRIRAALRLVAWRTVSETHWALGQFIEDVLPEATSVSVLVGSPGATQKITAQIRNDRGKTIGYLKYAEKPEAIIRLRNEHSVLAQLPADLGPALLKYGIWNAGEALLTRPVQGRQIRAALPPPAAVVDFCRQLETPASAQLEAHPWVAAFRKRAGNQADQWLRRLDNRSWPIVIQHGDVTWNLRCDTDGCINAFDWEYGTLEGFPGIDLASYVLQVANMIYAMSPKRAREAAVSVLQDGSGMSLTTNEATAVVCIAAYNLFQYQWDEGWRLEDPVQQWRKTLWEIA